MAGFNNVVSYENVYRLTGEQVTVRSANFLTMAVASNFYALATTWERVNPKCHTHMRARTFKGTLDWLKATNW